MTWNLAAEFEVVEKLIYISRNFLFFLPSYCLNLCTCRFDVIFMSCLGGGGRVGFLEAFIDTS